MLTLSRPMQRAAGLLAGLLVTGGSAATDLLDGDFSRDDPLDVRVVSYNHHGDFIDNASADAEFNRILVALDPDVICFQEFPFDISEGDVASRMNSILPTAGGWQIHFGLLGGIRTAIASRYPLTNTRIDTIPASSTRGVTIALVDLPDADYAVDLYLLGVHLKCCGDEGGSEDDSRQESADAIANWLGDARGVSRPSGDNIVLPPDTPMIVLGDFNLVGGPQPEDTLLTGDIQDESSYGADVKGDWDNSNLTNLDPVDPFTGDNFTWQGSSSFDPSPLDRMFYTDDVITVATSFVLNTDTMSATALANAGLQAGDTLPFNTSDHLPIIMDARVALAGCPDFDGDGVCDDVDPCPFDNPDDSDGDGVCDAGDLCPGFDDTLDADGDGVPDGCDCPGDVDGDGDVDLTDLATLLAGFGATVPPGTGGDLDNSGTIDLSDLAALLADFGCLP